MSCLLSVARFVPSRILRSLAILALALLPVTLPAQTAAGRFLLSPFRDAVIECNPGATNCFNVVANGSNHGGAELVSGASEPSIANNGRIAFQAIYGVDGTCSVGAQGVCWPHMFVMDADGTNVRQLTFANADPNVSGDTDGAISPDGSKVAFISNRNGFADANGNPVYLHEIYIVNSDGSGLREVTFPVYGQTGSPQAGNPFGNVQSVAWSPDSAQLVFKESTYGAFCGLSSGFPAECEAVGTINADGSGKTYRALFDANEAGSAWAVDWSPDGTLIAFAHDSIHFGGPAIAIIDLSGNNRYAGGLSLADLGIQSGNSGVICAADRHCLHFSPGSDQIAYENIHPLDNPGFAGISTIRLDGTGRQDSSQFGPLENGLWWAARPGLPAAAQLTLAPDPVEVWPGFNQPLDPALLDSQNTAILHTAASYAISIDYGTSGCINIGPYGMAFYANSGTGSGSIAAANEGLSSNMVAFKCWAAPPCSYGLTFNSESFPAAGGADIVGIVTNAGGTGSTCPWRAASNDGWITVTAGSSGRGNGNLSFSVAANTGGSRQGTLTIAGVTFTVNQDPSGPPALQSMTVSPATATVAAGLTQQFTATGHYSDGSTQDLTAAVTWSSSTTSVATISNSAGTQGRATGVSPGAVTITATLGSISGTAGLTVSAPVLVSIAVTPASPTVLAGASQQFNAKGTYSDGSMGDVSAGIVWASSNTAVATINTSGLASAISGGQTNISARVGSISDTTTMTVVVLQSLTVAPTGQSIFAGSTLQFSATGHYSDGSTRDLTSSVTWSSSKTSVATITTAGLATGVAKGNTNIKAALEGFAAATTLSVKAVTLQSITVTPDAATISVGGTQQFTATGHYDDGSTQDITGSVNWSTMPKPVASVSSTGLATGLKTGTTSITAKSGGISGTASLIVN